MCVCVCVYLNKEVDMCVGVWGSLYKEVDVCGGAGIYKKVMFEVVNRSKNKQIFQYLQEYSRASVKDQLQGTTG